MSKEVIAEGRLIPKKGCAETCLNIALDYVRASDDTPSYWTRALGIHYVSNDLLEIRRVAVDYGSIITVIGMMRPYLEAGEVHMIHDDGQFWHVLKNGIWTLKNVASAPLTEAEFNVLDGAQRSLTNIVSQQQDCFSGNIYLSGEDLMILRAAKDLLAKICDSARK